MNEGDDDLIGLPQSQIDALHAFYDATKGSEWVYSTGNPWNFQEDNPNPCKEKWQGIVCSTTCHESVCSQDISEMDLEFLNMNGTLPEEIGNFPKLEKLTIVGNGDLTGTLLRIVLGIYIHYKRCPCQQHFYLAHFLQR
eukprot:scaffold6591_cov328-Ochromonas_danica.AAC.13